MSIPGPHEHHDCPNCPLSARLINPINYPPPKNNNRGNQEGVVRRWRPVLVIMPITGPRETHDYRDYKPLSAGPNLMTKKSRNVRRQ